MSRESGWEVGITADGQYLQAGIRSWPDNRHHDPGNTMGWITRAVVLQTYFADEEDRAGAVESDQKCVTCDVRTYGRYARDLPKVIVLQRTHGLFDEDIFIPRPARQNTTGGDLEATTPAEDLDGDHVLVTFLENDPFQPAILPYVIPHPKAAYAPQAADGHVKRFRHNGTTIGWDADGNLSIDATGAARTLFGEGGEEESSSGDGGQIKLITSDGTHKTSVHLNHKGQILFGSDPDSPSDEPLVLGSQWIAVMGELIDEIISIQVGTGVGPSSPPINAPKFAAIRAKIAAKLHVSDFIFAKKGY